MSMIARQGIPEKREAAAPAAAGALPSVLLRPLADADASFLDELDQSTSDDEWDGYDDPPEDRLSGSDYGGGMAVVERADRTPVGTVTWIQVPHGPNRKSLAWCIGITIHPLYRGQRFGAAAQRALAADLFARSDANRVEAETDLGNIAERRSLEIAGFTQEGTARRSNWRRGEWHDMVIYSRLRSESEQDQSSDLGPA
jgi:aminoglycoside 6'-N-acetyltransferase